MICEHSSSHKHGSHEQYDCPEYQDVNTMYVSYIIIFCLILSYVQLATLGILTTTQKLMDTAPAKECMMIIAPMRLKQQSLSKFKRSMRVMDAPRLRIMILQCCPYPCISCLICTHEDRGFLDHSNKVSFSKTAWRKACKELEVKLEMRPELLKVVCGLMGYQIQN